MVLESQLPHKNIDLLFSVTNQDNMLTILCGVDLLKLINEYNLRDKSGLSRVRHDASLGKFLNWQLYRLY